MPPPIGENTPLNYERIAAAEEAAQQGHKPSTLSLIRSLVHHPASTVCMQMGSGG
jgi:hypothetical protein